MINWLQRNRDGLIVNVVVAIALQIGPGLVALVAAYLGYLASLPLPLILLIALLTLLIAALAVQMRTLATSTRAELGSENSFLTRSQAAAQKTAAVSPPSPEADELTKRATYLIMKDREIRGSESRGLLLLDNNPCWGYWRDGSIEIKLGFSVRNLWMDILTVENWGGKAIVYEREIPLAFDPEAKQLQPLSAHNFSCNVTWSPTQRELSTYGIDESRMFILGAALQPILNCLDANGTKFVIKSSPQMTVIVQPRSPKPGT